MPTKDSTPTELKTKLEGEASRRYYSELARLNAGLLLGVLALMTFLLTVGLQHPQKPFSAFVYACLIILPLSLALHAIAGMLVLAGKALKWASALRMLQQLLFILGVVAVAGFGIVAAHIFFAPAPAQSQTQAQ